MPLNIVNSDRVSDYKRKLVIHWEIVRSFYSGSTLLGLETVVGLVTNEHVVLLPDK